MEHEMEVGFMYWITGIFGFPNFKAFFGDV